MTPLEKGKPIIFGGSETVKKPEASALCIVCEFAMTEIDKLIGKKATEVSKRCFVTFRMASVSSR